MAKSIEHAATHNPPVKVVFFDIRDTLGYVDRPGHLVPFPDTFDLLEKVKTVGQREGLRVGVITNLPPDISADQGRAMLAEAGIAEYLDPDGIVINHEAGADKPDPAIYRYAARQMGVSIDECLFSGENYAENLFARIAGMQSELKPVPSIPDPPRPPYQRGPVTPTESGRKFEDFLQHEHLLGERIFACGAKIVEGLKAVTDARIPAKLFAAMEHYVYLINYFADQVHLLAEEAIIPLAVARANERGAAIPNPNWVFGHHRQARAYWAAITIAMDRIKAGDKTDLPYAIGDFWRTCEAFVILFEHHAVRENNELYKTLGDVITDEDDLDFLNLIQHTGSSDITPYIHVVEKMEAELGISA